MGTGQILTEGIETFTPVVNRVQEIGLEFVNYFIYIGLGVIGIRILREVVKYIMNYLKNKSEDTMQGRRTRRRRQRRAKKAFMKRIDSLG